MFIFGQRMVFLRKAIHFSQARAMATQRKRFYKTVDIVSGGNGIYEITLDSKKLKTPGGSVLTVENEGLALAVAQEWQSQENIVQLSQMHLTGLCNTCIDNPTKVTKYDLVDSILSFVETDTILFFSQEEEALFEVQKKNWEPILNWFNQRFGVAFRPSKHLTELPAVSRDDVEKLRRQLLSYNFNSVHGFTFGVDALKSIILMFALVEHQIPVHLAVKLARLEVEFQINRWGNVPWSHDLELHDTTARLSAAAIFFQCHNSQYLKKVKEIN